MSGSLFPRTLIVRRRTQGAHVNGVWNGGDPAEEIEIQGSVRPVRGRTAESDEAGRMTTGRVVLTTDAILSTHEQGADTTDHLVWSAVEWEVMTRRDRDAGILPHIAYECEYRGAA